MGMGPRGYCFSKRPPITAAEERGIVDGEKGDIADVEKEEVGDGESGGMVEEIGLASILTWLGVLLFCLGPVSGLFFFKMDRLTLPSWRMIGGGGNFRPLGEYSGRFSASNDDRGEPGSGIGTSLSKMTSCGFVLAASSTSVSLSSWLDGAIPAPVTSSSPSSALSLDNSRASPDAIEMTKDDDLSATISSAARPKRCCCCESVNFSRHFDEASSVEENEVEEVEMRQRTFESG